MENIIKFLSVEFINRKGIKIGEINDNEVIVIDKIIDKEGYYRLEIYEYYIYIKKNSLYGTLKEKGLRDFVCLTIYITVTLDQMTLEYALEQSENRYLREDNPVGETRYAILITGLPRSYRQIYPYVYNEWIKDKNPDVYITTGGIEDKDIDEMKRLYNPKSMYITNEEEINVQVQKWNNKYYRDGQITNVNKYRIYKMLDTIDITQYDFIIIMRTDVYMLRMFDMSMLDKTSIYTKHDMISIVPAELWKDYAMLNEKLYDYHTIVDKVWPATPWIKESRLPNTWIYTPENQLFQHVVKITNNRWKPHFIPFFMQYLVRSEGERIQISYNY